MNARIRTSAAYLRGGDSRTRVIFKEHPVMRKGLKSLLVAGSIAFAGAATVFAASEVIVGGKAMSPSKDIIDNAVNSADHTTLVAAVKAAALVETLKGAGPFTVFAPTNDAFENLPAGTVDGLLKPEAKDKLTKILTYHVVSGKFNIVTYDVLQSNGVIHVIDRVVLPK
jgi:uncharacterized surface protein with fasciclin (FAS1) repeats